MLTQTLRKLLNALEVPGSLFAALTWPKFSLSSLLIATRLRRHGIRPATIIDAGANEGQFAVAVAKLFPEATVYSFEPDPDTFTRLVRNVRAFSRVRPHLLALGDKRQQMPFYVDANTQVSSLLRPSEKRLRAFPNTRTEKVLTVNVDTLSEFFATNELARPILLKLDVQGYEHLVLEGAAHLLPKID